MNSLDASIETQALSYTGEVTIKKIKRGRPYKIVKKKNKSTKAFHFFLLDCILGNFDVKKTPFKIQFIKIDGNSLVEVFSDASREATKITDHPISESEETGTSGIDFGSGSVSFNFLIPETFTGQFHYVRLVDQENTVLAQVTVSDDINKPFITETGVSLAITWKITISSNIKESLS